MDYEKILMPIVEKLGKDAEFIFDDGDWEAWGSLYVGDVLFTAKWKSNGWVGLLDCLHDVKGDCRDLSNVAEWIDGHLWSSDELLEYHEDELRPYDEWDDHGFRNAQDYYHWRFGNSLR